MFVVCVDVVDNVGDGCLGWIGGVFVDDGDARDDGGEIVVGFVVVVVGLLKGFIDLLLT